MEQLTERVIAGLSQVPADNRYILGIVGFPGAGKSTLAEGLVNALNKVLPPSQRAQVVPMDGYHLSNETLEQIGLRHLKGIPDTFDPQGFIDLLKRIKKAPPELVTAPLFDRSIEASVPDAIVVGPEVKVVVTEGNYLLLENDDWREIADMLDDSWFLDTSIETIRPRLIQRHIDGGKTEVDAIAKVESTDLPNALLIEKTRLRAKAIVSAIDGSKSEPGHLYRLSVQNRS